MDLKAIEKHATDNLDFERVWNHPTIPFLMFNSIWSIYLYLNPQEEDGIMLTHCKDGIFNDWIDFKSLSETEFMNCMWIRMSIDVWD